MNGWMSLLAFFTVAGDLFLICFLLIRMVRELTEIRRELELKEVRTVRVHHRRAG